MNKTGAILALVCLALLIIAGWTGLIPECGPHNNLGLNVNKNAAFPYCISWYHSPASLRAGPYLRHI